MVTVAVLYPGHSAEDEFSTLQSRIRNAAFPVIHTWEGATEHDIDALLEIGSQQRLTPAARAAAQLHPDAVMWACTSGSFVYGWYGSSDQAHWVEEAAGVSSSSTSLAFVAAAHHLGVQSVAVAATYPHDVTAEFVRYLEDAGLTITAASAQDVPSGEDAGALGPDWVLNLARTAELGDAECLLLPDTALHTVEALPDLEAAVGMPVLTANQVTAWYGLILAGHPAVADGLGALFQSG